MSFTVAFTTADARLKISASCLRRIEEDQQWRQETLPPQVVTELGRRLNDRQMIQQLLEQRFSGWSLLWSFWYRNDPEGIEHLRRCEDLQAFISPHWLQHDNVMHTGSRDVPLGVGQSGRMSISPHQPSDFARLLKFGTFNAVGSIVTLQLGPDATNQVAHRSDGFSAV